MKVRKKIIVRASPSKASETFCVKQAKSRVELFSIANMMATKEKLTVTDLTQQLQDMREEYEGTPLRKI